MSTPAAGRSIFDFFISYKHGDSSGLVTAIAEDLRARKYDVWTDSSETRPGDSILKSITDGLSDCIDAIVVISANYFSGWAEHEHREIVSLLGGAKIRVVPLWYQLDLEQVRRLSPELANIHGIPVPDTTPATVQGVCDLIAKTYRPGQRRNRLYEMFFQCVHKNFPEDQDIAVFLSIYHNDLDALKAALEAGGNPNITDASLWNRYNRKALECCWPEWRKLYLYLVESGAIKPS